MGKQKAKEVKVSGRMAGALCPTLQTRQVGGMRTETWASECVKKITLTRELFCGSEMGRVYQDE